MGVVIPQVITEDKAGGAQVIDGGLRFDSNKNHSLKRLPTSNGSKTTWTWSGWVKRSDLPGAERYFWGAYYSNLSRYFLIGFNSSHQLYIFGGDYYTAGSTTTNINVNTNAVFRDTSAFYHIIVAYDTTQATSTNRIKVYVNGVLQQLTITNTPSQNSITFVNSSDTTHYVGAYDGSYQNFNGQMSNVYLIDGQQLDASYFGYTDPLTNTWRPKKYKPAATINDGRTWSSNYGNLRTAGTQTNPFDADNTNYAQVSVGGGGYFTFPDGLNGRLEVLASTGQSSDGASTQTVTISNNSGAVASRTTSKGYNTGPEAIDFGVVSGITSVFLTDSGLFWGFRINSITLRDGITETIGFGTNGFYLPLDGNTPIGQDQSGRGNNWTPVNFGGSNTIEKATGALPILNTDGGGKVARVGVRTDSNASSLVLALPLVGIKSDFSNAINSGTSNKTITANGNASASSAQSDFYGGSFYFDGTGDYLNTGSTSDFAFGTGDYTVECWAYPSQVSTLAGAVSAGPAYANFAILVNSGNWTYYSSSSNSSWDIDNLTMGTAVVNTWVHLAVTRQSGTVRTFLNGVLTNTSTGNTQNMSNAATGYVGYYNNFVFTGYIQDVRVYKGVAKYTSNFIPASTDPDILPDTPSGVAYSSNVALVPSTDGAVAFDGTGDKLTLASNTDFQFGTGDFTVEAFVYKDSADGDAAIFDLGSTNTSGSFAIFWNAGTLTVRIDGLGNDLSTTETPSNKWIHVAVARSGSTLRLFIDGDLKASGTRSNNITQSTPYIGDLNLFDYDFTGFISNLHIVKGTALYTSNFTPPTAPITSVANTKLLCCKSNSSATAADVTPGTITANGNAVATNFNPFTVNINTQRGQESGYCTLNPLDNDGNTLSNGNLNLAGSGNTFKYTRSSTYVNEGKWYWECTIAATGGQTRTGPQILRATDTLGSHTTGNLRGYIYISDYSGTIYISSNPSGSNSTLYSTSGSLPAGTIVGLALDATNGRLWVSINGVWLNGGNPGAGTNAPATGLTGPYTPGGWAYNSSDLLLFTFGQKPFKFPPPAGFQPLALANTPRPTIVRPDQYVGIATYSGQTAAQSITTGFKPDLVWIKRRNSAENNLLFDSIRGPLNRLISNATNAELSLANSLTSFNSNGFSLGSGESAVNADTYTYVAWCWKAGGNSNTFNINDIGYSTASAAGLTAGTITPTGASVNTKSGFSIIAFNSGAGSPTNYTVSHGLGKTPSFIITKSRTSSAYNWSIYHSSTATTVNKYLVFTTSATLDNGSAIWGANLSDTNSTTFGITSGNGVVANTDCIAYLWAEIPGFSKFGSYTGNGSTDGPMVVTGFRPRWIIVKDTTTGTTNWRIWDSVRGPYNPNNIDLLANTAEAENTYGSDEIDILSNGFKIRSTGSWHNSSGDTYIYAAFAETPSFNLYGGQANAR